METRRSKRLHLKENITTQLAPKSPAKKKEAVSNSRVKKEPKSAKKTLATALTSDYFECKTTSEIDADQRARKTTRITKSSYFESPIASESAESDYEPNDVNSQKSFESTGSESEESDYEADLPAKRTKRSRNTKPKKRRGFKLYSDSSSDKSAKRHSLCKPTQNSAVSKRKHTYESESDSSTDGFEKAPESLLDLKKIKSPSPVMAESHSNTGDEDAPTENAVEYFDFSTVLSQVTPVEKEKESGVETEKKSKQSKIDTKSRRTKKTKNKESGSVKSEQMEVFELLAMGENTDLSATDIKESVSQASGEYKIPNQVEVLLNAPVAAKKKRCNDLEMALRRRLNNIKRENQIFIHKVHVLCWIAHGIYLNSILNSPDILSVALSLLPSNKCYPPQRMALNYLEDLMNWFNKKVKLKKDPVDSKLEELTAILPVCFQKLEADNKTYFCFMFICLLKALGIRCRLVINLNAAPIKPPSDQLLPVNQKENETKPKSSNNSITKTAEKSKNEKKNKSKSKKEENAPKKKENQKSKESNTKLKQQSSYFEKKSTESRRSARLVHSNSKYFEGTSGDEKSSSKRHSKATSSRNKSKGKEDSNSLVAEMSSTDDSDFEETFVSPKKKKIDRRVLSSEDDIQENKLEIAKSNKDKNNYWMEVFLEAEERWFCVDIVKKNYLCTKQLYNAASHPVRYILAWNQDQTIKDVTRRYVPQYLTVTRKLRIDENWWKQTMRPYKPANTAQNREEDEELDKLLEEQPLPASISEYKNHPMYALERHLLKFQGIYPPDAPPLGFIKGEPVYSRLCVHQLHGREMWIKEAKVVKMNEKPYKIVKGRPQRTKFGTTEPPKDLELFGSWQVEDYVPPAAENGKVPRNAFGNVELFKPSMLPKGTVYLQIPGLQRIASKLNIDCAAAIVGFEYSTNGWSYPVKDGFVVCEEYKDILLDAFNQEMEEAEKKEKQKREERVYANWRRLIKGLLIRERLKRKYNFGDPTASTSAETKKDVAKPCK